MKDVNKIDNNLNKTGVNFKNKSPTLAQDIEYIMQT
jgi:hypothetical protein